MSQQEQQTTQTDTPIDRSTATTDRPEGLKETTFLSDLPVAKEQAEQAKGGYSGTTYVNQGIVR